MATNDKLEELKLSHDEIKRLEEALKKEEFRKLLVEYAEEIANPENRRRYEEEIAQLERERGMDVTFVKPEPGYVLKTSVNGTTKAFINISKSDKLGKPNSTRQQDPDGKNGLLWQIPHSFAPPREDRDKSKRTCQVYDFVIHPDTYRMAESNGRFKKLVEDTAMEGIEKQFGVKLDRKNVKRPKLHFKGTPIATVIRTRSASGPENIPDPTGILQNMPYPYDNSTSAEKAENQAQFCSNNAKTENGNKTQTNRENDDDVAIPVYNIIHRSHIDLQDFRHAPDASPSTRPKELVVKIELPLLSTVTQADLNIFEKRLLLESSWPAKYRLDLTLPYNVDDTEGSAKFDKQKRILTVTLPVVQEDTPSLSAYLANDEAAPKDVAEKPLIEVISSPDVIPDKYVQETQNEKQCASSGILNNAVNGHSTSITYSFPDFVFTQELETVSIILQVKNVEEASLEKVFPAANAMHLKCTSCGHGGFPMHYSFFVQFAEGCNVATSHCSVNVRQDNVTILLLKDHSARSLWQRFWAGVDLTTLKEHQLQTCTVLEQQLAQLDAAAADQEESRRASCEQLTELQVLTMDEKKLTIKVCPAAATKKQVHRYTSDEDEEYDPPSSAEIQVVHSRPPPLLHGILKQHTVSESSEDQNGDQESPRSPGEEEEELSCSLGKRRSVSFSEHIDQATFKTSSAVSSMTMALKSKRRRQRKREERGSRRRHNSGGSEGSGDDQTHSLSDSHSLSEEEGGHDRGLTLTQSRKWKTASSSSAADSTPKIKDVKLQDTSVPKCKIDQEGKGEIEITPARYQADSGKHCMLKHMSNSSPSAHVADEEAREKTVHPAVDDSSGNRCIVECGSDDIPLVTTDDSVQKILPVIANETGENSLLVADDKANNTICGTVDGKALGTQPDFGTNGASKPYGTLAERTKHLQSACGDNNTLAISSEHVNATSYQDVLDNKHSLEGEIALASKLASGNEDDDNLEDMRIQERLTVTREAGKLQNKERPHSLVNGTADKTDKNKIQESEKSSGPTGFEENQHRTQCAFKFSNTVIFDLDCE